MYKTFLPINFTFIFLSFICVPIHAQYPFQYRYGINEGLPKIEVLQCFFSSKGQLWIKTSPGEKLTRFDGINWTHYDLEQLGLPLTLPLLCESPNGTWWYNFSDGQVTLACYTSNGKWKKYIVPEAKHLLQNPNTGYPIVVTEKGYTYPYSVRNDSFIKSSKPLYVFEPGESIQGITSLSKKLNFLIVNNSKNGKTYLRYGTSFEHLFEVASPSSFTPYVLKPDLVKGINWDGTTLSWVENNKKRSIEFFLQNGRKAMVLGGMRLLTWKAPMHPANQQAWIVKDPMDNSRHLFRIDSLGFPKLLYSGLPKNALPEAAQDPSGNWWFNTPTGLVRSNKNILTFREDAPEMVSGVSSIVEDNYGKIWIGGYTDEGGFSVFDGNSLKKVHFGTGAIPVLPGAFRSKSGLIYFFAERDPGIGTIESGKLHWNGLKTNQQWTRGYYFFTLASGKIALGITEKGLAIVNEKGRQLSLDRLIGKEKGVHLGNVLAIAEDSNGRIWMGRPTKGVALYDPQRDTAVTWSRSLDVQGSIGVWSALVDDQSTLWLGGHDGLYQLPHAHQFEYLREDFTKKLHKINLPGSDETGVMFLCNTERYLVVGTLAGVYLLDKKTIHSDKKRIYSLLFGADIEGIGAEQNAVLLDSKGFLWIGAKGCATRIDLENLHFDTTKTQIELSYFRAGDEIVNMQRKQSTKLPLHKRAIEFSFFPSSSNFSIAGFHYDVAVVNMKGERIFHQYATTIKKHHIDHLDPGKYFLSITAYKHNVVSGKVKYTFIVPRDLLEHPSIQLLTIVLIIVLICLLFWQYMQSNIGQERAKRERDAFKVQTLTNFFNSHFINNTLHWMQGRYRKDPDMVLMVDNLAENVGILYKNIKSGTIHHSFRKELDLTLNYLNMQKIRFSNQLRISCDLPVGFVDYCNEVQIPALLLQIHAENAVEKGIRNRKEANQINIRISNLSSAYLIEIEDDGKKKKKGSTTSTNNRSSTLVMSELLQLLNKYNAPKITVEYEDLIFGTGGESPYGTRVLIHLPKNYNYELS